MGFRTYQFRVSVTYFIYSWIFSNANIVSPGLLFGPLIPLDGVRYYSLHSHIWHGLYWQLEHAFIYLRKTVHICLLLHFLYTYLRPSIRQVKGQSLLPTLLKRFLFFIVV